MAEHAEIERIAREVVNANTASDAVVSVSSKPSVGWTGDSILRVSVTVKDEMADQFQGEIPLNILTQLRKRLETEGESRFPIVDYATPADIAAEKNAQVDDDYPA